MHPKPNVDGFFVTHPDTTDLCDGLVNDCDDTHPWVQLFTFYVDRDGWLDYWWPETRDQAPEGFDPETYDRDDDDSDVH